LFLTRVLGELGYDAEWITSIPRRDEEDAYIGPFGFFSAGRWESHSWAECERFILDVTADQFGAPLVIVTSSCDPRYGKCTEDPATEKAKAQRHSDVETVWHSWLEASERKLLLEFDHRNADSG
jgi:hypothetical protein